MDLVVAASNFPFEVLAEDFHTIENFAASPASAEWKILLTGAGTRPMRDGNH